MRIDSVKVAFPSVVVESSAVVEKIREHSAETLGRDLERTLALVERGLKLSGARRRRELADGETPIGLIEAAARAALDEADARPADVDLLIYVGIGKGFLEPSQAYFVAKALGLDRVECFDVLDACMSWTRAMRIAEALLNAGQYRKILVVNGEFNTYEGGPLFPAAYRLESLRALEHTFASYTIGNAATATLVSADPGRPWAWRARSRPDLADLCTVPSHAPGRFSPPSDKVGKNGPFQFTSYGQQLHEHAFAPAVELMRELLAEVKSVERIFVHASSFREWDKFAREVGVEDKVHHLYPEYGNLVSASIPAGLATAIEGGLVRRGDRLAGWVGSAGMSFCAYDFCY
jgi:3-oxoacyl-[acyl-carrier-protein] synthase III